MKSVDASVDAQRSKSEWPALCARLNRPLREAFATLGQGNRRLYGLRDLLLWLARQPSGGLEHSILQALCESHEAVAFGGEVSHSQALHTCIDGWIAFYLTEASGLKPTSRTSQARITLKVLEEFSQQGVPGVPRYRRRQHNIPNAHYGPDDGYRSLGEAKWPELEGLGGIERERHALRLVRASFVDVLRPYFRLFEFGQHVLADPEFFGRSPEGTQIIRDGLSICQNMLARHGVLALPDGKTRGVSLIPQLESRRLWLDEAGVDPACLLGPKSNQFQLAMQSCFGPTLMASIATIGVITCDLGWNKQPTHDLPRNPFIFRSDKQEFIASENFIRSFKERRGDHVYAYITQDEVLDGARLGVALEGWHDTARELGPSDTAGYACVNRAEPGDLSLADILTRYKSMSDALLEQTGKYSPLGQTIRDRLIAHTSITGKIGRSISGMSLDTKQAAFGNEICGRLECTWSAIRKTRQIIRLDEAGSVTGVRPFAGHKGFGVLLPHYLNSTVINHELDQNIRDFQNALEAVATRDLDPDRIALALKRTTLEIQRARDLAEETGIAATLGITSSIDVEIGPLIDFVPTEEALLELFLIHRKLRQMQSNYRNKARFRRRFLPLLAITKAVGRELFARGLGPRYRSAARRAAARLNKGDIIMPSLED